MLAKSGRIRLIFDLAGTIERQRRIISLQPGAARQEFKSTRPQALKARFNRVFSQAPAPNPFGFGK